MTARIRPIDYETPIEFRLAAIESQLASVNRRIGTLMGCFVITWLAAVAAGVVAVWTVK